VIRAGIGSVLAFAAATLPAPEFRNIAASAGLVHSFPNGGERSKRYIVETTGSGAGFLDYDNDGYPDIILLSGPGAPSRLYHNDRRGRFSDVTGDALPLAEGWVQGVCAGDYDNDGRTDLFVTAWGRNTLLHNRGAGFEDVTGRAGLLQDRARYNTGCAFLDYDSDGNLDLFVANYVQFDFATTPQPGGNPYCWYRGIPVNCGPRGLPFGRNLLYHNNGNGTFSDVSERSGIAKPSQSYCLGALTGDFNGDGLTDIYAACDQTPSLLYINRGDGTFAEEALLRGVALDENGKALSGMGAASADYDSNGWPDIFRTNFSDERETLYRNRGKGQFEDATLAAALGHNTRFVGWGCGFFDFDNDGWKDLLLVNGHAFPEVDRLGIDIRYKDRAILYRNARNGSFADISDQSGPGILERHSARGTAFADYDNDGSVEVLINNQNEPPSLLKLAQAPPGNWIILKLTGTRSNRSGIGARVRVSAAGRIQSDEVRSGGSYLSQGDLRLHFGLGGATTVDRVEINWPAGGHQVERDLPVNQVHEIREAVLSTTDAVRGRSAPTGSPRK
jgi:enediyne biosynthesis protein E4